MPASSGTMEGWDGTWKGPVAATTRCASISPCEVETMKPGPPLAPRDALDLDPGAHGGVDHSGVVFEILRHPFLGREGLGGQVLELQAGKAVMPGGTVGNQRIPALGPPAFGDALAFKHEVGDAHVGQMFAHGNAGLSPANDEGVGFFDCHSHFLDMRVTSRGSERRCRC